MSAATVAAIAAVVIAGASAGFQVSEAQSAKRRAKGNREEDQRRQTAQRNELDAREAKEESEGESRRQRGEARRRQRSLSTGGQSRSDTLLTSPLGQPGNAQSSQKTLLGQ